MSARVALDPRVRAAFHPLPQAAPVGSVWLLADGQAVRIEADGTVEVLRPELPRLRSAASDPGARGARR